MVIVLDTNFLIYAIKYRIADQLKELNERIVVPITVMKELQKPTLGVKERAFASAALELVKIWNIQVIDTKITDVDKSIVDVALKLKKHKNKVYVATLDKKLMDTLLSNKIMNIGIKRRKIISLN